MESPSVTVRLAFYSIQPENCDNDKPPVIFLHGATGSKEDWNDIPQKVAYVTKRKVFAVDLRNHGDSEWSDDFSFQNYADDVLQFMNSLQVPKAIFVGHSLGGRITMNIACMANERVEKIVVEDISTKTANPSIIDMIVLHISLNLDAIEQLPVGLDEEAAKQFIANFVYKGIPAEFKEILKMPIETSQYDGKLKPTEDGRYAFKANMNAIVKALLERKDKQLEPIGVYGGPACFIYGKKSPFQVSADEEAIKIYFPKAELVGIENATHLVHSDCPQEFTDALLKFILMP